MVTARLRPRRSRRSFLAAAAVGTTVGCLGTAAANVRVLAAGSLARAFEEHVAPAFEGETGIDVHGEYYGSNAVMRMVEDRTKRPDVIVSADSTLLRERLYGTVTDWDVEFATNSLGIGYNEATGFGRHLADGEPWYEAARSAGDGALAIGDPDLDPLGYRAIQAFDLAEAEHGLEGFRAEMTASVYEEPEEPQMMAGVETGSRAGAIVYRNMAIDHGMAFQEFPDAYNFGHPELADHYAAAEYTTDEEGYTAKGRPILYGATVNGETENGHRFVRFLLDTPGPLREAALTVGDALPRSFGDVPAVIAG